MIVGVENTSRLLNKRWFNMLYLNDNDFLKFSISWDETIKEINKAVACIGQKDYSQPMKPYLRFKDNSNRIIAMPAYVGGNIDMAGIKWIASFPNNIKKSIPRASSVTVLNDTNTGIPLAIFNTAMVSIIRTASVSGYLLQEYNSFKQQLKYCIGIVGFGPIGQHHLKMCKSVLKNHIDKIYLYDKCEINISDELVTVCNSWKDVYEKSDIFITCTSSLERYIDLPALNNKLILDVSLRDFKEEALNSFAKPFIVDDWDEVNRENTDIEYYTKIGGIDKNNSITLCDIQNKKLNTFFNKSDNIFFAPMGMGVFDISIANYYYKYAIKNNIGTILE